MPSVGPFELTDQEFVGLDFLGQEDGRRLRQRQLQATWSGNKLTVKVRREESVDTAPSEPTPSLYSRFLERD